MNRNYLGLRRSKNQLPNHIWAHFDSNSLGSLFSKLAAAVWVRNFPSSSAAIDSFADVMAVGWLGG